MRFFYKTALLATLANALPNRLIDENEAVDQSDEVTLQRREIHAWPCNEPNDANVRVCTGGVGSVNSDGQTVVSNTAGAITLPTGATDPITTSFPDGETVAIDPSLIIISTTNSDGETVISNALSTETFDIDISTPLTTVLPNGALTTIAPDTSGSNSATASQPAQSAVLTTTNSAGLTIISNTEHGALTLTKSVTTPLIATFPDGESTTIDFLDNSAIQPTASSAQSSSAAFTFPVTTSVESPEPTDGGFVVPCDFFWFWDLCPSWDDTSVGGWVIGGPPGVRPPGPPPPIPPGVSVSVSIPDTLPTWPAVTFPPDGPPKASPKPEDCKTETGDLCFYHTSLSVVTTGQATTTSTHVASTCSSVVSCDVQGTATSTTATASSTPTALLHVIYPKDGRDESQTDVIAGQLKQLVGNPDDLQTSDTKTFGLNFWLASVPSEVAEKIRTIPNVASVFVQCGSDCMNGGPCSRPCIDPTTSHRYQDDVAEQLGYVSWARPQESIPKQYYFDDSAGEDVPVYIVDTGASLSHQEFNLIRNKARWIFVGPDRNGNAPTRSDSAKSDGTYHGTAMLSLVAGATLGVAKDISPIIVRLPGSLWERNDTTRTYRFVSGFTPEDWLTALGMVNDELQASHNGQSRCVVLLAQYFPNDRATDAWIQRGWQLLQELSQRGAILVTGQGNLGGFASLPGPIDGWPVNFGRDDQTRSVESLIVAAAILGRTEDVVYEVPGHGLPHVYAPGFDMKVADGDPIAEDVFRTGGRGTSDSAALTAGLAAYFLRLAQLGRLFNDDGSAVDASPMGMKNFIIAKSYSRFARGVNGIFNAIDPNQDFCLWSEGQTDPLRRRQEEQCLRPSSAGEPSSDPTISLSPSLTQEVSCHEESDFPGHADIHKSAVISFAGAACSRWTGYPYGSQDAKLGPDSNRLAHTYHQQGVTYAYSVEWVEDCKLSGTKKQSVYTPVGSDDSDDTCLGLWTSAFEKRLNGGVGGSVTLGCLRYTFTGGE